MPADRIPSEQLVPKPHMPQERPLRTKIPASTQTRLPSRPLRELRDQAEPSSAPLALATTRPRQPEREEMPGGCPPLTPVPIHLQLGPLARKGRSGRQPRPEQWRPAARVPGNIAG